ncbi:MAG: hypothetical protein JOZ38_00190 [Candidatus Eremiobacteraeota bacterium]|nr:hypothetical protein [Candidatus Eremiobacteraeota bacterium]
MIAGLLVLCVFAIFAALMYRRVMPALLAVPAMAICMAAVAGVPAAGIATIVVSGSVALAKVYVTVIFGALLSRVTLDTGVARSIVNFAAEFGGDRPWIVALVLCVAVAGLFVTLSGLGAVIMVGSIVLPVMMTVGVPRAVAATLFLMGFALGFIFNIVQWTFYTKFFGVTQGQMQGYALILAGIDVALLAIYAAVSFRKQRGYATWAVEAETPRAVVPWYALVTPVLPIVLYFGLHLDPIVAFLLSSVYGAVAASPLRAVETLAAAAIRGVEDVAPAVLLFVGIGMLFTATQAPQFNAALTPLVANPVLRNPVAFVIFFGLLSPLVLYRGPLNPYGVGIAVFTVLLTAHVLPPMVLVAAVMAVVQVQNVCDPTNTQNVWVGNFTGVHPAEILRRTLPYQVAVATIACVVVVTSAGRLFGTPFALEPAAAAENLSGLYAPARAAYRVGVAGTTADARLAARYVIADMDRWPMVRAFISRDDPNAGDCTRKPYAAFVRVTSSRFALIEGTDLDIGVELLDCGGWSVDEWHDHRVFSAAPSPDDVGWLATDGVRRMFDWTQRNPILAQNLLERGLAFDPGRTSPTYFYSLFKTVDGNMRAYVRTGGPAYAAGLRSDDVVQKIDGKYWWEYGTYQSQLRAYDGKPHSFDVMRGTTPVHVELGEAFDGKG